MAEDEYEGLSSSFAEACRKADAAHGPVPEPPPIPLVSEHGVPSAAQLARIYEQNLLRRYGVAQSTYDAVQYVLRHYGDRYEDPDWLMTRLARFSPRQLDDLLIWIDRFNINPRLRTLVARFKR